MCSRHSLLAGLAWPCFLFPSLAQLANQARLHCVCTLQKLGCCCAAMLWAVCCVGCGWSCLIYCCRQVYNRDNRDKTSKGNYPSSHFTTQKTNENRAAALRKRFQALSWLLVQAHAGSANHHLNHWPPRFWYSSTTTHYWNKTKQTDLAQSQF